MVKTKKVTMEKVMNNPAYRGYHVIVVGGKVFKARTGERESEILDDNSTSKVEYSRHL